jgi:hypothetical protein
MLASGSFGAVIAVTYPTHRQPPSTGRQPDARSAGLRCWFAVRHAFFHDGQHPSRYAQARRADYRPERRTASSDHSPHARSRHDLILCRGGHAGAFNQDVFVREQLQLQVPVAVVRERLLIQLQTDGLYTASSEALNRRPSTIHRDGDKGDGHGSGDGQVRTDGQVGGDGKVAFESRHLTVDTLPPYVRGPVTVLPIRWITDGARDGQPSLDANLEFGPSETDATTKLLLVGVFRPMPPDSQIDYGMQQRVSRNTARRFLTKIAALVVRGPPTNMTRIRR